MVDTLRADYLGCYGFKGDITPNIDALARESTVFTRFTSPAPWTKPAIASLFTSLHPQTHKVTDHLGMHWKKWGKKHKASVLSPDAVTLAEVLQDSGYDTLGFIGNDFLIRRFGFHQGFNRYYEPRPHRDVFSATPLLNKALKLLRKGEVKAPYFMYFHFMDVHGPFQCRGSDIEVVQDSSSLGADIIINKKERRRIPHELGYRIPWRGSDKSYNVKNWRACYAAGVRKFDRRLGVFLKSLKTLGHLDNTILILTSDHGEELYDHRGWAHSHTLYNELLRIPFIFRLPGREQKGRTAEDILSLVDVMPTLMRMTNANMRVPGMAGRNFSRVVYGRKMKNNTKPWVFGTATRKNPNVISIEDKSFKMIWDHPTRKIELFNLKKDPLEQKNIFKKNPKLTKKYKNLIQNHLSSLKKRGVLRSSSIDLSDDMVEKLKALGYLQ